MSLRSTIIVFDIRNFSAHREYLARLGKARILSDLVRNILDESVDSILRWNRKLNNGGQPAMNYTGDGFIIVVRGERSPLTAMLFASEFRRYVEKRILRYRGEVKSIAGGNADSLPPLSFGIGLHHGVVTTFWFKKFSDPPGKSSATGFIGNAVNVAAKVEQCTKDHACKVIATIHLIDAAEKQIRDISRARFNTYVRNIGQHCLKGLKDPITLFICRQDFDRWFRTSMLS